MTDLEESSNEKLRAVERIANNVLYFDDGADYGTALWEILAVVCPKKFKDDPDPELEFMEKPKEESM